MGAVSDRIGRKLPLVAGMLALAGSTLLFALADSLPRLFAARLVQGAADAVTWVVGFALIADCYGPAERGRVMGFVMSGTSFGFMIGPSIGGWLYEAGGIALPFLFVAALALVCAVGFAVLRPPSRTRASTARPSIWSVMRVPAVAFCAAAGRRRRRHASRCSSRCCRCSSTDASASRPRRSACCSGSPPSRRRCIRSSTAR